MIKVSIHQENIIILNVYVPYNKASKFIKPKLIELQQEIEKLVLLSDFNNILSIVGKPCNQKIIKKIEDLNNT